VMVRSHYDPEFCKQDEEVLQTLEAIGSVLIYSHTRILYASIDSGCLCLLLLGRYPGARRIGNADQLQPLLRRLNLMHLPNVPKQLCLSYASSHHQRYSFYKLSGYLDIRLPLLKVIVPSTDIRWTTACRQIYL